MSGKQFINLDKATSPQEIERRSFEIIESEIPEPRKFEGKLWKIARRCIHAIGDPLILEDLILEEAALTSGLKAMQSSCTIYTDTRMLAAGLVARRMDKLGINVKSIMELPDIGRKAEKQKITRSRAGIKEISEKIQGNIIGIGNAPTALLALLEELAGKDPEQGPALIVGMPVGFVNAAQSKELLCKSPWPKFTLKGRKGGSALAAAAINAMADIILEQLDP